MAEPRVTIITGGAGGMGAACAERLGQRGPVILVDVKADRLKLVSEDLRAKGLTALAVHDDITDAAVRATLVKMVAGLGTFGTLVNTAGLANSMAKPERVMHVNLVGTAQMLEALLPLATQGSSAILIASGLGHSFRSKSTPAIDKVLAAPLEPTFIDKLSELYEDWTKDAYSVSKYGVQLLAVKAARQWGERAARVLSISPGLIRTPMSEIAIRDSPAAIKSLQERAVIHRFGMPVDIANLVNFLSSEEASFMTGVDILIDGGLTNVAWAI